MNQLINIMEKLNFEQILEVLKEKLSDNDREYGGVEDFAYGDFGERAYPEAKYGTLEYNARILPELGEIYEIAEASEGGEGKGEYWCRVFYFKDHDVYIKVIGFYTSYSGTDFNDGWDCCKEVKPQQKTITVYESL